MRLSVCLNLELPLPKIVHVGDVLLKISLVLSAERQTDRQSSVYYAWKLETARGQTHAQHYAKARNQPQKSASDRHSSTSAAKMTKSSPEAAAKKPKIISRAET